MIHRGVVQSLEWEEGIHARKVEGTGKMRDMW